MKVRDIMTKDVAHINPDAKVTEAAQLMQKHNIGSVPVCDQRGLVGIVTDRDIVVRNIASGKSPQETPVRDVMTGQVNTATPDMDVDEVTKMMATHKIRRVPRLKIISWWEWCHWEILRLTTSSTLRHLKHLLKYPDLQNPNN